MTASDRLFVLMVALLVISILHTGAAVKVLALAAAAVAFVVRELTR